MLQIAIIAVILSAIPQPPQNQGGTPADVRTTATPQDSITVPDGTPLTLELESDISSATERVGDTVTFTTPHQVRINGLVIVPKDSAVSGTVVKVAHPRRLSRDGQLGVAIEELALPSGERVTLRPRRSGSTKSQRMATESGSGRRKMGWWLQTAALNYLLPFDLELGLGIPVAIGSKGKEQEYPSGTRLTVYFNGPLELNRGAVVKLQAPPYEGPAQIFFRNTRKLSTKRRYKQDVLFCGQKPIGDFFSTLRLELNPGTYVFRTDKPKEKTVQLEVQQNHQYWIGRDRGGLHVSVSELDHDEIEAPSRGGMIDNDLTTSTGNSCVEAALP